MSQNIIITAAGNNSIPACKIFVDWCTAPPYLVWSRLLLRSRALTKFVQCQWTQRGFVRLQMTDSMSFRKRFCKSASIDWIWLRRKIYHVLVSSLWTFISKDLNFKCDPCEFKWKGSYIVSTTKNVNWLFCFLFISNAMIISDKTELKEGEETKSWFQALGAWAFKLGWP